PPKQTEAKGPTRRPEPTGPTPPSRCSGSSPLSRSPAANRLLIAWSHSLPLDNDDVLETARGPLVGRSAELDRLTGLLADAAAGPPAVMPVSGAARVGKTRL